MYYVLTLLKTNCVSFKTPYSLFTLHTFNFVYVFLNMTILYNKHINSHNHDNDAYIKLHQNRNKKFFYLGEPKNKK